ncbi:putative ABC transporter permease yknZ [Fibrisoma limi BUZ 3]|uniref:Putative ABC transporter permease yknZ n=1 Tax=Fibrisoma limi BUZ 3 TaxID=1185876 RepID=I2GDD6_9BACT|nr:ABC transporter permease [Fibrisoma limi]CCH51910.1 putative ABC transporter permease yknZ [Fibrisoma limi BUZ 3]
MLLNYLKIAWRNVQKNWSYALINVTGLGLGIGCALLIFALVRYHYQTDQHHHKYDQIYQFASRFTSAEGEFRTRGIPYPFGQALRTDHPELNHVAMLEEWGEPLVIVPAKIGTGKKIKDKEQSGAFVEPAYFQLFDYQWLAGGPEALNQPNTVVISARMARKCFGRTANVVGQNLLLDARVPARIVGVFADYQDNTDLAYSIMASWTTLKDTRGARPESEPFDNTNSSTHCYALFNDRFTLADWNRQQVSFVKKHNPKNVNKTFYPAEPFSSMHLSEEYGGVSRNLLLSLLAIGFLLVGTASINFVNLATAQALKRAREVGVRKVMGSTRSQLFWQFMGETALIVVAATILAMGIFDVGQALADKYLTGIFRFRFYFSPAVLLWLSLLVMGVILLSGLYPAFIMAGFRPVTALASRLTTQPSGSFSVRSGLVIAQFAISQILIIGLAVVANQLEYMQDKELGFRKKAVVTVALPSVPSQDKSKMATFRNLATTLPGVDQVSYSMGGPPQSGWTSQTTIRFDTRQNEESFSPQQAWIDADYVDVYKLKLIAGRNLQPSDTAREAVVNETFVKRLGLTRPTDALGKFIHKQSLAPLEIVGVLNDYNQSNLRVGIEPLFLTTIATGYYFANISLSSANYQQTLAQLEKAYNEVYSDSFFEPQFVDEQIRQNYQQERTMSMLINFFAGVSLLIGSMGLYGLVLFMVGQKRKEIGIRKVLGASVQSLLWLFNREFARLILIAFAIAAPLSWWVMTGWLANFQYKITIGPAVFLLSLLATVLAAALTVSFQSVKAALMNPVKSLRTE